MERTDAIEPVLDLDLFGKSKDQRSIEIIRDMEPDDGYWLAFSGGKDSVVLLDLAKRAGVRFEAHHNLTTIDPPELVQFVKTFPEVQIDRPEKSFWRYIRDNLGLPMRSGRWCCRKLKERGGVGRRVLVGMRAAESRRRAGYGLVMPCTRPWAKGKVYVSPMLYWADEDVWAYIHRRGLRYCSLYDEGWHRLGCVLCPFESRIDLARKRWPKLFDGLYRAIRDAYPTQAGWQRFGGPEAVYAWYIGRGRRHRLQDEQMAWDQFGSEDADDDGNGSAP